MSNRNGFAPGATGVLASKGASVGSNGATGWPAGGYHGTAGMERWVGLGVIAHNLHVMAQALAA